MPASDAAFREGLEAMKAPLAEWESTLLAHHFREMTAEGDPYALTRTIEMALRRRVEMLGARVLALYAERQGEVYEVIGDQAYDPIVSLPRTYAPGDRVRVVREEAK